METGKKCSQVSHCTRELITRITNNKSDKDLLIKYLTWRKNGAKTIILKANEDYLRELIRTSSDVTYIFDAGLTQIEPNSLTVLGLFTTSDDQRISRLKLL